MSPPARDSAPPDSRTLSTPSFISQPCLGNSPPFALRQPWLEWPSHSSCQPAARSASVSVFGRPVSEAVTAPAQARTEAPSALRIFAVPMRSSFPCVPPFTPPRAGSAPDAAPGILVRRERPRLHLDRVAGLERGLIARVHDPHRVHEVLVQVVDVLAVA